MVVAESKRAVEVKDDITVSVAEEVALRLFQIDEARRLGQKHAIN